MVVATDMLLLLKKILSAKENYPSYCLPHISNNVLMRGLIKVIRIPKRVTAADDYHDVEDIDG